MMKPDYAELVLLARAVELTRAHARAATRAIAAILLAELSRQREIYQRIVPFALAEADEADATATNFMADKNIGEAEISEVRKVSLADAEADAIAAREMAKFIQQDLLVAAYVDDTIRTMAEIATGAYANATEAFAETLHVFRHAEATSQPSSVRRWFATRR